MNGKEWMEKLGGKKSLWLLGFLIAAGILLIVLSYAWPEEQTQNAKKNAVLVQDEVETRLARVLSQIAGAGQVEILVMEDGCDGVRGVLIVADGADELTVRTELMRAAMTALDVPASSVEVFARRLQLPSRTVSIPPMQAALRTEPSSRITWASPIPRAVQKLQCPARIARSPVMLRHTMRCTSPSKSRPSGVPILRGNVLIGSLLY